MTLYFHVRLWEWWSFYHRLNPTTAEHKGREVVSNELSTRSPSPFSFSEPNPAHLFGPGVQSLIDIAPNTYGSLQHRANIRECHVKLEKRPTAHNKGLLKFFSPSPPITQGQIRKFVEYQLFFICVIWNFFNNFVILFFKRNYY